LKRGAAISVDHVTKRYRLFGKKSQFQTLKSALLKRDLTPSPDSSITALDDVSFQVARGESFGIIGPNGSGKSTMLKLISGILKPTRGIVAVDGRVSALIELGAGFHPEISGRENVYINGIMLGLTKKEIDSRFGQIVEFAGIGSFLDQPVKTYSSGMYVRLGFAVAVHADPDILLVDEVLSVGDEEFSQKCVARIKEMKYRGVTMIFVTHQLDLVRTICDRAMWLDHGRAEGIGEPIRVIDQYLQKVSGQPGTRETEELPEDDEAGSPSDDEEKEERWGSGEIVIQRATLLDDDDNEIIAVGASTPVTIELEVDVREEQTDCAFGIGIFHADGTCVYGTNTDLEGWTTESIGGAGRVRFVIPSLDLVAGTYRVDAAAHTRKGRSYDYRRGVLRFVVGSAMRDIGVYRPPHRWEFTGDIRMRRETGPRRDIPTPIAESLRELEEDESDDR